MEQMRLSSSTHGKELLLILSHVLVGAGQRNKDAESADEMFVLVQGLLEEMVAPDNWNRSRDQSEENILLWKEEKSNSAKVRTTLVVLSPCLCLSSSSGAVPS